MSYWTEHGGLNMHPEVDSENHPLFRAYYEWWCLQNNGPACTYDTIRDFFDKTNWMPQWYQANIPQAGDHFSRDNMWGIYFLRLIWQINSPGLQDLPVFKWNGKFRWHPNQWAVFLSLKSKAWKFLLCPLVKGMYIYSKKKYERDPTYTSGPCLWALMKYFLWDELPTLEDVEAFKYYVTNGYRWDIPDNPILLEIEKYERT